MFTEALNKETELIGLERIAKKRASEANELVEVGKKGSQSILKLLLTNFLPVIRPNI